ncbi:SDR family NAD(P)-dependent oxidoreductase [Acidothermaceae bacterium B102]|nr:SDR family NAD(P)-dependent oxidoreductase [Acidothermaceae bacterium B102]
MSRRLEGKVAVVTGAATGIGRAHALKLAAEGASVAVLDLSDGSETVAGIEAAGSKGASFIVDVTNPEAVTASAGEVEAALGSADILVNNAGIYPNQMFDGMTLTDWRRMFAVNVESMFLTCQAYTPAMKAKGWGRIINMTSNSVALVIPGFTHYIASKMAVIGLTRGLATELAEYGITANAIGPSLVRTASTEAGPEIFFEIVPQLQAIKRLQLPDDLTGTMAFLASDDAAFVTGQTFWIDGGLVRSG